MEIESSNRIGSSSRIAASVFLFALALIVTSTGCGGRKNSRSKPDGKSRALNVNVITAQQETDVYDTRTYFGTIKPQRSSQLGFARGGRVKTVSKSIGDTVAKNEEIAVLDQSQLDDNLADLDEKIKTTQEQLRTLQNNPAGAAQQIRTLQQEIAQLQRQRQSVLNELENGIILAPYKGIIAKRDANEGDAVPAGRPFFKIVEDAAPIVEVNVAKWIAERIPKGQRVWVLRDDVAIEATVETKSPELNAADRTRTLRLKIVQGDAEAQWIFGEIVEVRFWIKTNRIGFWLPYSTLQKEAGGLWSAYVVAGTGQKTTVERRTLELLQIHKDIVLVRGALKDGDLVVANGLNRVVPGQRVTTSKVARTYSSPGPPGTTE